MEIKYLTVKSIAIELIISSIMLGFFIFGNTGIQTFLLILFSFLGIFAFIGAMLRLDKEDKYSKVFCWFHFFSAILTSAILAYLNSPITAAIYLIGNFTLFAVRVK